MTPVLVIGLDGVPLDLVRELAQEGALPNLETIMAQGVASPLRSTMPPTSGPAWSSFITGKQPGRTGVYDFLYRHPGSYTFYPHSARSRAGRSLWSILSDAERQIGVLNVPMTYPVEAVNGAFVSGWMTPYSARDFTYPPELLDEIREQVGLYHIYPTATLSERRPRAFFQACHQLLDLRTKTALHMMQQNAWDFFMVVFFDTDRILHQAWHYLDRDNANDGSGRGEGKAELVRGYFRHLDQSIGQLIEQAGPDTVVMVMSDHGMGPARNMITLNTWLLEEGLIRLKSGPSTWLKHRLFNAGLTLRNVHRLIDGLGLAGIAEYRALYSMDRILKRLFLSFNDVDWARTRAYSFGRAVGPIYLNVDGREPRGIVQPGAEYERTRAEIADKASELRDPESGEKLVGRILLREEIYQGPLVEQAPDLILIPRFEADTFFGLADFGANKVVQRMYRYTAMHRDTGMLLLSGPGVQIGANVAPPHIVDLAPTILRALDVPIPPDMDGRPLAELFQGWNSEDGIRNAAYQATLSSNGDLPSYTDEQVRELEQKLRDLGYMG